MVSAPLRGSYYSEHCSGVWETPPDSGYFRLLLCASTLPLDELELSVSQMPPGRRLGRRGSGLEHELADSLGPFFRLRRGARP